MILCLILALCCAEAYAYTLSDGHITLNRQDRSYTKDGCTDEASGGRHYFSVAAVVDPDDSGNGSIVWKCRYCGQSETVTVSADVASDEYESGAGKGTSADSLSSDDGKSADIVGIEDENTQDAEDKYEDGAVSAYESQTVPGLRVGKGEPGETAYETTDVDFLYEDLSFWSTSARARTINCMIIPVHFTDGYGFDDYFESQVDKMFNGTEQYCVRQYYQEASYGSIDLQYEIMPVYEVGMSSWDMEAKWSSKSDHNWYSEHYWQIYDGTRQAYEGDLSRFDTDQDGYADLVIMVFDDPSVSGEDTCGTLYGGKVTSVTYEHCIKDADPEYPSVTNFVCMEKYMMMPDDGWEDGWRWEGDDVLWMTLVHEIGHVFGLPDLYDNYDADEYAGHSPLGGFDLHDDYQCGTMNCWSRMSLGWLEPYVIDPDVEDVRIRLRCSALYPDCILIPTSKGWNGTPFDEFMLVDVFANAGDNQYMWDNYMLDFTSPVDPALNGGIRIIHVDTRLCYLNGKWFDASAAGNYNKRAVTAMGTLSNKWPGMANSMAIGGETGYSPEKDTGLYFPLHMMKRSGTDPYFTKRVNGRGMFNINSADLFSAGTCFSMESHASAFSNAPYMNNGGTFDYRITVDEYDPDTMEAVVHIQKIG